MKFGSLLLLLSVLALALFFSGCCCGTGGGGGGGGTVTTSPDAGVPTQVLRTVWTKTLQCDYLGLKPYSSGDSLIMMQELDQIAAEDPAAAQAAMEQAQAECDMGLSLTKFEATSEQISGSTATVTYTICVVDTNGKEACKTLTSTLQKIDGQWKTDWIHFGLAGEQFSLTS